MNIPTLFFISLGIAAIGAIAAVINFITGISRPASMIVIHLIAGLLYVLAVLGTIGFGIAWIVTYLKH